MGGLGSGEGWGGWEVGRCIRNWGILWMQVVRIVLLILLMVEPCECAWIRVVRILICRMDMYY